MPNDAKLKPCPFCGKIEPVKILDENDFECLSESELEYIYNPYFTVCCDVNSGGCGACGGFRISQDEAAEAWNGRADNA